MIAKAKQIRSNALIVFGPVQGSRNQFAFDVPDSLLQIHRQHMTASGPFCGHRDDQFVVRFEIDVTNKPSGERSQLDEVALYTLRDGRVVQEEFLYRMG